MYRSFLRHAEAASERYGIDVRTILVEVRHKQGVPSGTLPWVQSKVRVTPVDSLTYVQFEDAGDGDFNDIWATVEIT